ncbi:MAG: hypothetical protein LBP42_03665 [Treponema sp.]|jgi:hypothetical protein|nr:hypothetical protein [Treponema sp.]
MKKERLLALFYILILLSGSLYAVGEQVLSIGGASTWQAAEARTGIIEIGAVRPYPVLALSSSRSEAALAPAVSPDLALSFDEGKAEFFADQAGRYQVLAAEAALEAGTLAAADRTLARAGAGAALFAKGFGKEPAPQGFGASGPIILIPGKEALFAPGKIIRDFSIEFWLYPMNMESGEEILSWVAVKNNGGGDSAQRIQCAVFKNRFQWTFRDFFSLPGDHMPGTLITLNPFSPLIPRMWSHHLIRFDSATGLLEYLVNGRLEGVSYATTSGREGGEVYTPLAGAEGSLILGGRFAGLLDELRIYESFFEDAVLAKYPSQGGWIETRLIDLGEGENLILRVDASGGRVSPGGLLNEYRADGPFRFSDESTLQFFIRTADSLYRQPGEWRPFLPGKEISGGLRGRFVQLAALFYPSGDGETTPYLEELRILYQPDPPPLPPMQITAIPRDGGVDLSWKASHDADLTGYLVYYGLKEGNYLGDHALLGVSPIDAGKRTSIRIDGLRNGTLYYFAVAAYDRVNPHRAGMFSREVTARPLRMLE